MTFQSFRCVSGILKGFQDVSEDILMRFREVTDTFQDV